MLLFENLSPLANDCISQMLELFPFLEDTKLGYDLIEEMHKSNLKAIEETGQLQKKLFPNKGLTSLDAIRIKVAKMKFPNIEEKQHSYVMAINKSIIIYGCAIFDDFLNQTIRSLLIRYPQKIASEKKVIPFYEFLQEEKVTIIESIVEKEIYELSYKRIDERIGDLSKRFELDLEYSESETSFFSNQINLKDLKKWFAIRNIIVHNKGIIDKNFLKSVPEAGYSFGAFIDVSDKVVTNLTLNLIKLITCISKQVELRYN